MISYKDMTFCGSNCVNKSCRRYFSEYHQRQSRKWGGSNDPPISWSDFSKECPDYIAPIDSMMYSGKSD